jgi:hypothetical protein
MEYVVETQSGRETVAAPWNVRPVGMAGLSAAFL